MNKQILKLAGLGIGVVLITALLSIPVFAGEKHQGHKMHMAATKAPAPAGRHSMHSMHEIHMKKLDDALKAIDNAGKAFEAGNKHKALAELDKARQLVAACKKAMSELGKRSAAARAKKKKSS